MITALLAFRWSLGGSSLGGVDLGLTDRSVDFTTHVTYQVALDDLEHELEGCATGHDDVEGRLAGGDGSDDLFLLIGRASGAGEVLALLNQVEDDRPGFGRGAVRPLDGEGTLPFAVERRGGLGGGWGDECSDGECDNEDCFHGHFVNDVYAEKVPAKFGRRVHWCVGTREARFRFFAGSEGEVRFR